jgi:arsenite methyltransferase
MAPSSTMKPDYGVDAPNVMRNMFLFGALCIVLVFVTPRVWHFGPVAITLHYPLAWTGGFLLLEGSLFLLYVKFGKFRHRDFILSMHPWRGDEQVLDVGCGRGLLLAAAAKHLTTGHATGLDIWSNVDMGGNSEAATLHNLQLERIESRCTLISAGAQTMPFAGATYDRPTRTQALQQIARVLKPGGIALISDYKLTGQYATELQQLGLKVERRWGSWLTTFPPLRVVIARKPL